jgi:enoyl-CoA hydratase/carnithine racemase
MTYEHIIVEHHGPTATITMNRPARRNALSLAHLGELLDAVTAIGHTSATGLIVAGNGPVFSAGHDFADIDGADLAAMDQLVGTCSDLMLALRSIPQVTIARVHALATAAGCQLVAACDLAVAAESSSFAVPGGKGGWFCTTPMVAVGRAIPLKRAVEMAFTGDAVDAATACSWGLVNEVVPDGELLQATADLLGRATRGSASSKAIGKQALYAQLDLPLADAYRYASDVMAKASQTPDAREGVRAFLDKRPASWSPPGT